DENLWWVLQTQVEQMGYAVQAVGNGDDALISSEKSIPALVLSDLIMPGLSGMELLQKIRASWPEIPVIIMTAFGTIQSAVGAMRVGAYDYLSKPIDYEELLLVIRRALEHFRLLEEVQI